MKKEPEDCIKAEGKTNIALAKVIFCGKNNMEALFLKTGWEGKFWIDFGKKSEIVIPVDYRKTNEFESHWFEIYDDEKRILAISQNFLKTKKNEIYQYGNVILIVEVDK